MAWIESHQELGRHPKLIRLARKLEISKPAAVGHLQYLWWWAMDFAQDGDVTNLSDDEVADAAMWEGDPHDFVNALVEVGFLDQETGSVVIHDWFDYAGKLIEKRKANTERMRRVRAPHVQNTCNARAGATVPNRTVPNPTEQDLTEPELVASQDLAEYESEAAEPAADAAINSNHIYPDWYEVLSEVSGMSASYEMAEGWRARKRISIDLAERKAYAVRDWWPRQPSRRTKNGDPYATWQSWCRGDRDSAPARASRNGRATRVQENFADIERYD